MHARRDSGRYRANAVQPAFGGSPPDCRIELFESLRVSKNRTSRMGCPVFGTPEGTRTPDLLIRSQSLYPTELLAHTFAERLDIVAQRDRIVKQFLPESGNYFLLCRSIQAAPAVRSRAAARMARRAPLPGASWAWGTGWVVSAAAWLSAASLARRASSA